MAKKPKPKKPATPPSPPLPQPPPLPEPPPPPRPQPQPLAGYAGPPWWDSITYPVLPFSFTRAKNIDRSLMNMVEDFGAPLESISLEPVGLPVNDHRRIMVELRFQIRGVDYCCALPIVIAPGVDDDVRIRMVKAMMRQKLKADMQLAFHGWGMMELMDRYLVKPAPTVPPPAQPPATPPVSTSWRSKTKRKGKQPPSNPAG